jgi:hypothetical protein
MAVSFATAVYGETRIDPGSRSSALIDELLCHHSLRIAVNIGNVTG